MAIIKVGGGSNSESSSDCRKDPITEIKTGGLYSYPGSVNVTWNMVVIWTMEEFIIVGVDGAVVTFCINLIVPVC